VTGSLWLKGRRGGGGGGRQTRTRLPPGIERCVSFGQAGEVVRPELIDPWNHQGSMNDRGGMA
jgi:hypothetical protein